MFNVVGIVARPDRKRAIRIWSKVVKLSERKGLKSVPGAKIGKIRQQTKGCFTP